MLCYYVKNELLYVHIYVFDLLADLLCVSVFVSVLW